MEARFKAEVGAPITQAEEQLDVLRAESFNSGMLTHAAEEALLAAEMAVRAAECEAREAERFAEEEKVRAENAALRVENAVLRASLAHADACLFERAHASSEMHVEDEESEEEPEPEEYERYRRMGRMLCGVSSEDEDC